MHLYKMRRCAPSSVRFKFRFSSADRIFVKGSVWLENARVGRCIVLAGTVLQRTVSGRGSIRTTKSNPAQ